MMVLMRTMNAIKEKIEPLTEKTEPMLEHGAIQHDRTDSQR